MADVVFLYVTAPEDAAAAMAETLVEARLAACVNIIPRIRSVYRWKGAVDRGEEAAMIVKTLAGTAGAARAAIERLHPYKTPVIAALGIDQEKSGDAFLNWVSSELSETFL